MSERRPRVVLIGLGPTAKSALHSLSEFCEVVGLLRPGADEVTQAAAAVGATVVGNRSIEDVRRLVSALSPDAVVVSSYDRILPPDVLEGCPVMNVHYAPLPRYRGRATVNWALLNGEPRAWISIHEMVPDLDAGDILYSGSVPITDSSTVSDLYAALDELQRRHLGRCVVDRLAGHPGTPQDVDAATYCCTRIPADGEIEWADPTVGIDRLVRALTPPAPGAFTYLGLARLLVDEVEVVASPRVYEGRIPGRVVGVSGPGGHVDVLTGDGVLRLVRLRTSDMAAPVPASTVITSVKTTLGLRTTALLAKIAELESRLARLEAPAP